MSKRINNKRGAGNPRQTKTLRLRRERTIAKAKEDARKEAEKHADYVWASRVTNY